MAQLGIGPVPSEEDCFPAGHGMASLEAHEFRKQMQRLHPGAPLAVRCLPHDSAPCYEVVVLYDPHDERSCEVAFDIEEGLPDEWDSIAKAVVDRLHGRLARLDALIEEARE